MMVPRRGFERKYAFGGSGIFDAVGNIMSGIVTSNAAKELASAALDVGKNVAKSTATDVGKRMVKKALTPKSKNIINKHTTVLNKNDAEKINELVKRLNKGMGIKKT